MKHWGRPRRPFLGPGAARIVRAWERGTARAASAWDGDETLVHVAYYTTNYMHYGQIYNKTVQCYRVCRKRLCLHEGCHLTMKLKCVRTTGGGWFIFRPR